MHVLGFLKGERLHEEGPVFYSFTQVSDGEGYGIGFFEGCRLK
ncbi:hypothetical protein HAT2_00516 [Candidatus Similichlamydia laticola]|uniref:Uncharacterized protein n=1 Tax=Candidatus Similichlamydia laticola TaxID=2170265 RepID=A0A369K9V1_9BACT|nr:hypothetical protein HAT2_00516 [Candidatus Similichlamydia laticola]